MKQIGASAGCALLVCAALVSTVGIAISGEVLPWAVQGNQTFVVNLATGATTYSAIAQGSHMGRTAVEGTGLMDGAGNVSGSGSDTSAEGDQVFWDCSGNLLAGSLLLTLTGGTGRFDGATGQLNSWEITNVVQTVDPVQGTLTITCDAKATGWISY